jgi:hypothetical protein
MRDRAWLPWAALVMALALAASVTSLTNGFVLDDVHLIARSARMHSLSGWWREFGRTYWPEEWGSEGYRPLMIVFLRAEWVLGGGEPFLFHAVNIGLHVAGSVAVFWLAVGVLPFAAACIAAALYAVHPVHVESVANVVGQSELWVALLVTLAVGLFVHGRIAGPIAWKRWLAIGVLYAIAMLFKEHAIVMPALLLLAEMTVVLERAPVRQRLQRLRLPMLALAAVGVAYLWVRNIVVVAGLAGFTPFIVFRALDLSAPDRILTMIGAAPEWLRLLLWPARLITDYAPPYIEMAHGLSVTQLPGLVVLGGTLGLMVACWRRSPATSFGIGWVVLTLLPASNFIVPAGFIIAERTLLLPSIGAMIAVGSVIPRLYELTERSRVTQMALATTLVAVVALGLGRSISRNAAWRSNDILFRQGVIDAPRSYRAHAMLGVHLFENFRKSEGEIHYRHALALFPYDPMMVYDMAEKYRGAGMCEPANTLYRWLFTMRPNFHLGHIGYASCLLTTFELDDARREALLSIERGGRLREARDIIRAAQQVRDTVAARRARGEPVTGRASR